MAQQGQAANVVDPPPAALTPAPAPPAQPAAGQNAGAQVAQSTQPNSASGSAQFGLPLPPSNTTSGTRGTQSHFTIPVTAPAGEFVITQPSLAAQAGVTSLFKIWPTGNPANASANLIVFGWNLTNVYEAVKPTSITVRAKCDNGYTYPVGGAHGPGQPAPSASDDGDGNNGTTTDSSGDTFIDQDGIVAASESAVTWDPVQYASAHGSIPVPQGLCTLQMADDRGFTAVHRAGYLSPNTEAVVFALYTGEAYTPLASGFTCQGCKPNSISSAYNANPIVISLLVTVVVCLLSGAGILVKGKKSPAARHTGALRDSRVGQNGIATGVTLGGWVGH